MGIETERKFLVDRDKWEAWKTENETAIRDIEQGYLSMDPDLSIRVRLETIPQGDKPAIQVGSLDVKGKLEGMTRKEVSFETGDTLRGSAATAKELLEMCGISKLYKRRYRFKHVGLVWEIDEFERGLILAELEITPLNKRHLDSDGDIGEMPPFVGKEVTDDPAYYNVNLVRSCPT